MLRRVNSCLVKEDLSQKLTPDVLSALVPAHQSLVNADTLIKYDESGAKADQRFFVLTSDMLHMLTVDYLPLESLSLETCWVYEIDGRPSDFQLQTADKELVLGAATAEEKALWLHLIRKSIDDLLQALYLRTDVCMSLTSTVRFASHAFSDGRVYAGQWRDACPHGVGAELNTAVKPACFLQCEWVTGKARGLGVIVQDGLSNYSGCLRDGCRYGVGVQFEDGKYLAGEWTGDAMNGHGVAIFSNGDEYQGQLTDGVQSGWGVLHLASPLSGVISREGTWVEGGLHGRAISRFSDGSHKDHKWKRGVEKAPSVLRRMSLSGPTNHADEVAAIEAACRDAVQKAVAARQAAEKEAANAKAIARSARENFALLRGCSVSDLPACDSSATPVSHRREPSRSNSGGHVVARLLADAPAYEAAARVEVGDSVRDKAALEFLTSEARYGADLLVLPQCFSELFDEHSRTMKAMSQSSRQVVSLQVTRFQSIYALHLQLFDVLLERFSQWDPANSCLGDKLLHFFKFCKMYVDYCEHFDEMNDVLNKESAALAPMVRAAQENGRQLSSCMILPVQRVPRYQLLTSALMSHTPETHPDYESLRTALSHITQVNEFVNTEMKKKDRDKAWMALVQKLSPADTEKVLACHRSLVLDAALVLQNRPGGPKSYHFVLTTDVLCYFSTDTSLLPALDNKRRSMAVGRQTETLKRKIRLDCLWVDHSDDPSDVVLRVKTPSETLELVANSVEKRSEWERQLNATARQWLSSLHSLNRTIAESLPEQRYALYEWADGSTYGGMWANAVPEGMGVKTYASGEVFRGEWMAGQPHGLGIFVRTSGATYSGEFNEGDRTGHAIISATADGHYRGQCRNGEPNGYGVLEMDDGGRYEGTFANGHKHGAGVLILASKDPETHATRMEGHWCDNHLHGQTLLITEDGSTTLRMAAQGTLLPEGTPLPASTLERELGAPQLSLQCREAQGMACLASSATMLMSGAVTATASRAQSILASLRRETLNHPITPVRDHDELSWQEGGVRSDSVDSQ